MKIKIISKKTKKEIKFKTLIAISKKYIKSSVERNKKKRQIRSILMKEKMIIKKENKLLLIYEVKKEITYQEIFSILNEFRLKNIILF